MTRQRKTWIAIIGGGFLTFCGPVGGIVATMFGLTNAFGAVGDVPVELKTSELSEGISTSMWGTAGGLIIGALGVLVLVVGLVVLFLDSRKPVRQ